MAVEERFADGNTSVVVRVGDTVRRAPGPWTPAVHALLRHLEGVGLAGVPRVRGFDDRGREQLSFVPGQTVPPDLSGYRSEAALGEVARLLRRYHDATVGFVPPAGAAWRWLVGAPRAGEVICHNDVGPWNVVVRDGRVTGLIDFDLAAPGPRTWDIAYALWRWVPLYGHAARIDAGFGGPAGLGRRVRVFCDAYGLGEREDSSLRSGQALLDLVEWRIVSMHDTLEAWAAGGDPAFGRLWREGHANGDWPNIAYLRAQREALRRGLAG